MSKKNFAAFEKNKANYIPLSPLSFLYRTANIFGDKIGVIDGKRSWSWQEFYNRCKQLASSLIQQGIKEGDTVSVLSPNSIAVVDAHFGIPMCGAVINTINTRLDEKTISYILKHSDCKLLIVDSELLKVAYNAMQKENLNFPVVCVWQKNTPRPEFQIPNLIDYEDFLSKGNANYQWQLPQDEWQALSLNYTSGTSGQPKGVVYHHRGSYLMSLGTINAWQLPMHPIYLYTVPMFHCNGWGHCWSICAVGGTIICQRNINAKEIFQALVDYKVNYFGGAPTILNLLVNALETDKKTFSQPIKVMTAGAPPAPAILKAMKKMGFDIMQVYGLTETYGHITHCLWRGEWDDLSETEQAEIKSWQGIPLPMTEEVALLDLHTAEKISYSSNQQGEIAIRSNTLMKGYYKDAIATQKAFAGDWFHSGDIAVWKKNNYMQVKDRLKDVIISGGENISSIEVENVLYNHPAVLYAAVVAQPNEKWGEVPCAFLELKEGFEVTSAELNEFCRKTLAGFKAPKHYHFCTIPKTTTGKIQKFLLRQQLANTKEK